MEIRFQCINMEGREKKIPANTGASQPRVYNVKPKTSSNNMEGDFQGCALTSTWVLWYMYTCHHIYINVHTCTHAIIMHLIPQILYKR